MMELITGMYIDPVDYNISHLTVSEWDTELLKHSRFVYFISLPLNANESWSGTDYLISGMGLTGYVYSNLVYIRLWHWLFLAAMTLYTATSSFSELLKALDAWHGHGCSIIMIQCIACLIV